MESTFYSDLLLVFFGVGFVTFVLIYFKIKERQK